MRSAGCFARAARSPASPRRRWPIARSVSALTADASELTKDYVRPYTNPDGIDSITVVARPLLTPELVSHAWGFTGDNATVLTARVALASRPSPTR